MSRTPFSRHVSTGVGPNYPAKNECFQFWWFLPITSKTHCYSALCQWLNDFILIWFIEFKPFSVDRLNNCIFRELDQHESEIIQEVNDFIHIQRNVGTIENCRRSEKRRLTCLTYSNFQCTSYLCFLRCLCQREMYCPLDRRSPATDYANKLPAPDNLVATWTRNTV